MRSIPERKLRSEVRYLIHRYLNDDLEDGDDGFRRELKRILASYTHNLVYLNIGQAVDERERSLRRPDDFAKIWQILDEEQPLILRHLKNWQDLD